jgi:hypothetical protein
MDNKPRFSRSCMAVILLGVILLLIGAVAFFVLRGVSKTNLVSSSPPSVFVNTPTAGESISAGKFLMANVAATGQNPIARIEMWMDGTLVETQTPGSALGEVTTFYATASIPMEEGLHIFSARAVDAKGLIGQSLPINIQGTPSEGEKEGGSSGTQPPSGSTPTQPGTGQPSTQPPVAIIPPTPLPVTPPNLPMLKGYVLPDFNFGKFVGIVFSNMPKAPTNLQAGYENCFVRLVWMDNATDETHFNVWMQALGGPPMVIATLQGTPQTGPAWYEFASPSVGIYSFWIEAANAFGGQSSEIAWVGVTDLHCGSGVATHLTIEILDMHVAGGFGSTACYLSLEGSAFRRTPNADGMYIPVLGGFVDVSNWTGSGKSILIPIPADNEITLEGKCIGKSGAAPPVNMGTFTASAPKETWDSRRMELKSTSASTYTIGYRIQPQGPTTTAGAFTYTDYSIPSPSKPFVVVGTSSNPSENEKLARLPTLHWTWSGDFNKLTGFTIFMDGKPFQGANLVSFSPGQWEDTFFLPTSCGGTYKFQVAANAGSAQSVPSPVYEHKQPPCEIYAEVKFETITFTYIDDAEIGDCDVAQAYYKISVNHHDRDFGELEGDDIDMDCGEYYFSLLPAGTPQENKYESVDTFIVPISAQNPSGNDVFVWANFLDNDPTSSVDHLCIAYTTIKKNSQAWVDLKNPEQIKLPCDGENGEYGGLDARGFVTISVRGFIGPQGGP